MPATVADLIQWPARAQLGDVQSSSGSLMELQLSLLLLLLLSSHALRATEGKNHLLPAYT